MNIFKRKYVRSEWLKGLIDCEKYYQEGYRPDYNDFNHRSISLMKAGGKCVSIPKSCGDFYDGFLDYIKNVHHYENN